MKRFACCFGRVGLANDEIDERQATFNTNPSASDSGGFVVTQAGPSVPALQPIDKTEILSATKKFVTDDRDGRPKLSGEPIGGGKVCCIAIGDKMVAVKVIVESNIFKQDLGLLKELDHPNVIKVVDHCSMIFSHVVIVYDSMPLGTLDEYLYGSKPPLDWNMRIKIALDIAKVLEYVHSKVDIFVILEPENILLDQGFVPKITSFGRPRITGPMWDVNLYKYGVLLFQLLSGRSETQSLLTRMKPFLRNEERLGALVDSKVKRYPEKGLRRVVRVAEACLSPVGKKPDLKTVVEMMTEAASYKLLPEPDHGEGRSFTW